jgi:hypothetical protein
MEVPKFTPVFPIFAFPIAVTTVTIGSSKSHLEHREACY